MERWQVELITAGGLAMISFFGGYGKGWLKYRNKLREAELRDRERQAELEELRKMRRMQGSADDEKIARLERVTSIAVTCKVHQIDPSQIDVFQDMINRGRRTKKQIALPDESQQKVFAEPLDAAAAEAFIVSALSPNMPEDSRKRTATITLSIIHERGPNSLPVGYDEDGNKVEWIPSEDGDGAAPDEPYWPIMLLRNPEEIGEAEGEFFDKVWWNRHESFKKQKGQSKKPSVGDDKAKEILAKYGRKQLMLNDFEWGMVNGKLSALRWVTGAEWDFLDT